MSRTNSARIRYPRLFVTFGSSLADYRRREPPSTTAAPSALIFPLTARTCSAHMASDDKSADKMIPNSPSSSSSNLSSSNPNHWKQRILIPTVLAGIAGGASGLVSKHRKVRGLSAISATYASNFAIITGCYCGAREFVRVSREGKPDDLLNSVFGGFGSGAILGRLQAGPVGAARYSMMFAVIGTAVDYTTTKIMPAINELKEKDDWLVLPEWSPIKILDEEAVAAKRAREEKIYRNIHNLKKEES